jgi:hypothetical protein
MRVLAQPAGSLAGYRYLREGWGSNGGADGWGPFQASAAQRMRLDALTDESKTTLGVNDAISVAISVRCQRSTREAQDKTNKRIKETGIQIYPITEALASMLSLYPFPLLVEGTAKSYR